MGSKQQEEDHCVVAVHAGRRRRLLLCYVRNHWLFRNWIDSSHLARGEVSRTGDHDEDDVGGGGAGWPAVAIHFHHRMAGFGSLTRFRSLYGSFLYRFSLSLSHNSSLETVETRSAFSS
jgi:hypothetical protein